MKCYLTILFAACIGLLLSAASLCAAVVTVTNTNDAGSGSLRQAILDANPGDSIVFNIPTSDPGYYAPTGVYTINLTSADLQIDKNLGISAFGSHVVVRRNTSSEFPVFVVSAGASVGIANLTISNGSFMIGGGLDNAGLVVLDNCTFSGNQAEPDNGGEGGGLYCFKGSTATVRNCTFIGNQAAYGGAISNHGGTLILSSSTVSGNYSFFAGGGVENAELGTAQVRNTIIAGNDGFPVLGTDVSGTFDSEGYNFIGDPTGSGGFGGPDSHDQVGVDMFRTLDPKLGPLRDNGGDTPTMAPMPGSLVIDQGKRGTNPDEIFKLDQRGFPRPIDQAGVVDAVDGDGSDIGAVELSEFQTGPSFTVTTANDHDDAVCGLEDCTLREALNVANADADANTVSFAAELTGMTITNLLTPDGFVVSRPITINGPGARLLAISGGDINRCLQVNGGPVVINGLYLRPRLQ